MKTKIILLILCLTTCSLFAQNDIENIRAAFISPHNNHAYFFIGKNKVYQYNPSTKERVAIRTLGSDAFKGIAGGSNIDAAFAIPNTKKAFLFRGNKWYRYNMQYGKLESEGVVGYNGFKGLTGPFNGATVRGPNYVFFKGDKVYFFDPKKAKVIFTGTVNKNNLYTSAPKDIDGVIEWTNSMLYFFKDDDIYYRYNPRKKRVDYRKVIGQDGFKNLFPSIDAALETGAAFQRNYYWESPSKTKDGIMGLLGNRDHKLTKISSISSSDNKKKTTYGLKHFEGIPPRLDAVLYHGGIGMPYFLKGSKFYRYNSKIRTVDQTGDVKAGWKGLPTDIDAAFSSRDGYHYFFKRDRFWKYNYKTKRLDSGNWIKTVFNGVPNYLDAAVIYDGSYSKRIFFYKKNTEYVYDISKRRVVAKNSIAKITK